MSKVRSIPFTGLFPVLGNPPTPADSCTFTLRYARILSEFVAHFPNLYIYVLWCWGVIRYAKLVLCVSWSSSGYAQLGPGCKRRKPSTSNSIG